MYVYLNFISLLHNHIQRSHNGVIHEVKNPLYPQKIKHEQTNKISKRKENNLDFNPFLDIISKIGNVPITSSAVN